MGAVLLCAGLFIAAVGLWMANANPETLLQHDRRTGGWLFASELRRSGSYEVALRAAARFYRRFGFALAAFAGLACVFGAVLLVV